ncbi:AcrR family transcriptional regulator [Sphingomonas naasensis]|uniref:TetR/AcrR family transcriptional regulator n=1 Tax=Sphingomonas naasensis TaxID=1344951 RepID=A0A4S1WJH0_9SPHN|nr:TetR/AcrR family transcriptional regulator [Sphingomonas naasensis]NIJ21815.1 AcrR family transcriptional regulator [Sphingomonas naasensis]TGX42485.1 TetR/AcrR family transcriptional regulator [Sphingomonas naasensis]
MLRDALVKAALDMLEQGEEPSLRAVARAAGVSAMAPYRHFADKAALLSAVAEQGFAALAVALVAADVDTDPRAALIGQGLAYIAFARARPALFRLMFASDFALTLGDDSGAFATLADRVASLGARDPQAATTLSWATVHGLAMLALDGRLPDLGEDGERRVVALLAGAL